MALILTCALLHVLLHLIQEIWSLVLASVISPISLLTLTLSPLPLLGTLVSPLPLL